MIRTLPLLALLVLAACGPSRPPLPAAELERPQRVLVVTIDRDPVATSSWRPGLSLGIGFGSYSGGSVSGGVGMSGTREGGDARRVREDLMTWDFRPELQKIFMTRAVPPAAWSWVDGEQADPAVVSEIDRIYDTKKASAPALAAYARANDIQKVLVIDPVAWGLKRNEGFFVEVAGRLFEASAERTVVWEARAEPKRARRPFFEAGSDSPKDREAIRQSLRDSAAESVEALAEKLRSAR